MSQHANSVQSSGGGAAAEARAAEWDGALEGLGGVTILAAVGNGGGLGEAGAFGGVVGARGVVGVGGGLGAVAGSEAEGGGGGGEGEELHFFIINYNSHGRRLL